MNPKANQRRRARRAGPGRSVPGRLCCLHVLLVALSWATVPAFANARLEALVQQVRSDSGVDWVDLAVTRSDGRCTRALYSEPLPRMQASTVSRLFTATVVLQLVAEGSMALDDPLGRWLPAFDGSGITVQQLLEQRSGLSDHLHAGHRADDAAVAAYVAAVARRGPDVAPGTRWRDADVNYNLLGRVIERLTGRPFASVLQDRLLAPLGMLDSTFRLADVPPAARIHGQVRRLGFWHWAAPREDLAFAPSNGLQTNATDLSRFLRAVLSAAEGEDDGPVRPATVQAMTRNLGRTDRPEDGQGLGWRISRTPIGVRWWLGGGAGGLDSLVAVYPDAGFATVVMGNRAGWPSERLEQQLRVLVTTTDVCPRYPSGMGPALSD